MKPPGAALLLAGYGAGLVTGLARFPDPALVALALLAAGLLLRDEWYRAAILAAAFGVVAGAVALRRAAVECAATLPLGEGRYTLRLIDPGVATGRAVPDDRGCRGAVEVAWPRSTATVAGAVVIVEARWEPRLGPLGRPGGLLSVRSVLATRRGRGAAERMRAVVWARARALYGDLAPVAAALVIGWRGAIDPTWRQEFAAAGLMPLLAISGLHIALLAGWVLLLLRAARVPRTAARFLAAALAVAYAAWLGWPAPAVRAVTLMTVLAWSEWRQRRPAVHATLAVSALAVTIENPWAVVDPGAWLSVLGLLGVLVALRWCDRCNWRNAIVRAVAASAGAAVATAPVAAFVFGRVAPIGVILNPVATPLLALAMPCLLVSLLVGGLVPAVGAAFAASANLLLRALLLLARIGAAAPGAARGVDAGFFAALPWLAALAAATWIVWRHTTPAEAARRLLWTATAACWLGLVPGGASGSPLDRGKLALVFLDVGQGDGALLRTPAGHWIEVDAGPVDPGWDAGRRVVEPALRRLGAGRIDLFVLSHAHRDHVGGATAVVDAWPVGLAVEPGEQFADSAYDRWLGALHARDVRWHPVAAGDHWIIDGVDFRVLHPPPHWAHWGEDLNEDSVVLDVRYEGFRALLMGDAGRRGGVGAGGFDRQGRCAEGRPPRVGHGLERRISRGGAAAGRGGQRRRPQHLRASGAGDAVAAGAGRGHRLADRPRWNRHRGDRRGTLHRRRRATHGPLRHENHHRRRESPCPTAPR